MDNLVSRLDYAILKSRSTRLQGAKVGDNIFKQSRVLDASYSWITTFYKVVKGCRLSLGMSIRVYCDKVASHTYLRCYASAQCSYENGKYVECSMTNLYKHYVTLLYLAKKHNVVLFDQDYAFEDWYLGRARNAEGVLYTELYDKQKVDIEAE